MNDHKLPIIQIPGEPEDNPVCWYILDVGDGQQVIPLVHERDGEIYVAIFLSLHDAEMFLDHDLSLPMEWIRSMIRFSFGGGTKALLEKIGEMVDSLNVHGVALCSGSGTVRTIPNDEIIYTFAHLASDAIAQQARNAVRDSMVGSSHIGKHGITYR